MNISDEQVRIARDAYFDYTGQDPLPKPIRAALEAYERARAPDPRVVELQRQAAEIARILNTVEFVKQSTKNANAGFVDMRDWGYLQSRLYDLLAALAAMENDNG